jgi:hypothetical protein
MMLRWLSVMRAVMLWRILVEDMDNESPLLIGKIGKIQPLRSPFSQQFKRKSKLDQVSYL